MAVGELPQVIAPTPSFRKQVEELSGQKISACFQCQKCTNGCPVTFAMDIMPHKLIRSVHMGLKKEVMSSDTIWVCASCETCTTRCPNGIDIAHIMDTLRELGLREGAKVSQRNVPLFHNEFLGSVGLFGRVHEMQMAALYALKSGGIGELMKQRGMGIEMFKRGKLKILPSKLRATRQVRQIFRAAKRKVKR